MHVSRRFLQNCMSVLEVLLATLMTAVIVVLVVKLIGKTFFTEGIVPYNVEYYIGQIMSLAIGIEFAKMLFHHTPGTIIEVMMFAISRHMIVEPGGALETLLGVAALGSLFAIRKYLFSTFYEDERIICKGQLTVRQMDQWYGIHIPADRNRLLCDVIREHLKKLDLPAEVGTQFHIGDATLRIHEMSDGSIRRVEIVRSKSQYEDPLEEN